MTDMNIPDSARLQFAMMSEDDVGLMVQLDSDPEVMRFINGGRATTEEEIRATSIPRMHSYTDPERGWGLWKVTLAAELRFIGWILIRPMNFFTAERDDKNLEIGWRFIRDAWGNGYATEAAAAVIAELERNHICDRFTAVALSENVASINVMQKIGMRYLRSGVCGNQHGDETCVFYEKLATHIGHRA